MKTGGKKMKKWLLILTGILCTSLVFGASSKNNYSNYSGGHSSVKDSGGPDDYGYTWSDSGITYNWIDITTIGTEVTVLQDDNNAGPFNIGFEFPYYWYHTNKFWVNSNGSISFNSSVVHCPQSDRGWEIPSTIAPNDLVIPFGADFTFESGGQCYYYTNNIDTLVVSFIDVPAWAQSGPPTGAHTFQLILVGSDSSIIFQYGTQTGAIPAADTICAGIENISGTIGLQYLKNTMPTSGVAAKFTPPISTSYEVTDVCIQDVVSPESKGIFASANASQPISAVVNNIGNVDVGSFDVFCTVVDAFNTELFNATQSVSGLIVGVEDTINFSGWITAYPGNTCTVNVTANLTGDMNTVNNSVDVEVVTVDPSSWLAFFVEDTMALLNWWFGTGSGWGMEFAFPGYPAIVDSILIPAASPYDSVTFPVMVMDDDGANGGPGTILFQQDIHLEANDTAREMVIPYCDTIESGKIYVGMFQTGDSSPAMMIDIAPPFSRRAWEYTGSWTPSRDKNNIDYHIALFTDFTPGIEENFAKLPANSLRNIPNPMVGKTTIQFAVDKPGKVSLKIYNLSGQVVKTLIDNRETKGLKSVVWDGKDNNGKEVTTGVYFYELNTGNLKQTKKLVLIK